MGKIKQILDTRTRRKEGVLVIDNELKKSIWLVIII